MNLRAGIRVKSSISKSLDGAAVWDIVCCLRQGIISPLDSLIFSP